MVKDTERQNGFDGQEPVEYDLLELDSFDTAFAVGVGQDAAVRRRFMTLFVDSDQTRLSGTSGVVSKAVNARGETFAVKRLHPASGKTPAIGIEQSRFPEMQLTAFREEYKTQLQVSHMKGFPRLYGYGTAQGDPLIIMEWVEGTTLEKATPLLPRGETNDSVDPRVVAQLGRDLFSVLSALDMLADRPVHRDLSPTNIMIRTSSRTLDAQVTDGTFDICLVDFGSATLLGPQDARLTMTANVWRNGTPEYAPPEMLTLDAPGVQEMRQSPSIDVYACASILYELLRGQTPFQIGESKDASPYRTKMDNEPEPLGDGFGALGTAIMAGLRQSQDERPSAAAMCELCVDYLEGIEPDQETLDRLVHARRTSDTVIPDADYGTAHLLMSRNGMAKPQRPAELERADAEKPSKPMVTRRSFIAAAAALVGIGVAAGIAGTQMAARDREETSEGSASAQTASYTGGTLYTAQDASTMLWGFLNSQRLWVVEPRFDSPPGLFSQGLASARDPETGLVGFIDYEGEWTIEPRFKNAVGSGFSDNGLACVVSADGFELGGGQANRVGWIDKQGSWSIPPQFLGGGIFRNGLAACSNEAINDGWDNIWGYIDEEGAFAIPATMLSSYAFSDNGLACVKATPTTWGWIDKTGAWAIEPSFTNAGSFSESLAAAYDAFQGWGFIDASQELVIAPRFRDVRWFSGGRASCQDDATGLWGMIDANGNWTIEPKFLLLGELAHGLAPAQDSDTKLYGYIDDQGEWVIPPQFAAVGLAARE